MFQRIRALSYAGMVGGIGIVATAFVYANTHGTTTVNNMGQLLGLNEQEWGRIAAVIPALLWAALLAFRLRIGDRITRLSAIGYRVASAALAIRILSELPQFFIDMRTDYQSPLGMSSWLLYLLSLPLLSIGMLSISFGCKRIGMGGFMFYAPLLAGLLTIPSFLAGGFLAEISDNGAIFRSSAVLLSIPQGLAWIGIGIAALLTDFPNRKGVCQ
ncbi:hypothetical protein RB620_21485 [Paenibacillus sp. LHD-117]|uniref:hypothetical protein n=1 Tax=Paenibacillus sp. LHD-117 TaxID=3071412 RepID=UPI0027E189D2|nr:hypothetical protein [Paenibacillus sp. LHD-117]MDQ6422006.1 hypothetical protein [Paenibacillus sp. LHD-117]